MAVHLTINGKEIETEDRKTILEAAQENGIYIPTLCYHSHLRPIGSCRLCIVDIEGSDVPKAACTTRVSEGMKVHTNSGRVRKMRQQAMELILMHHPLDCPICDKGGECQLQDLSYEFGIKEQPFHAKKPDFDIAPFCTPLIRQWPERCVVCLRCVSVCKEVVGNSAITLKGEGYDAVIYPSSPENCLSCGECLSVCPVGALTEALSPVRGRVWQIERTQTTCGQCGVGCQMEVSTYEDRPINVKTDDVTDDAPNFGSLCARGRFFYDYMIHESRVTQPRVRKGEEWASTDWEGAYEEAINRLRETLEKHGPESIGMIVSSRLPSEELARLYAFARQGLKTPHVDASHRLDLAPQIEILKALNGGGTGDPLNVLEKSDVVIVAGGNIDLNAQVVANRVRVARRDVRNKVIVVNPFKTPLDRTADISLTCNAGTETPVFYGLIKEALSENPDLQKAEGWEGLSSEVADYAAEAVCEAAQIDAKLFKKAVDLVKDKGSIAFVVGADLGRMPEGNGALRALANLALACRAAGKTVSWIPTTGYANAWGSLMAAAAIEGPKDGLTYGEMIQAIDTGKLKALIVVEEDPLSSLPGTSTVEAALKKLDFLMVVDLFETPTAKRAHLFLPSTSFMEKSGTFINMEGQVKRVTEVFPPMGDSRSAARIFEDIAAKMKLSVESGPNDSAALIEAFNERQETPVQGFFPVAYQPTRMEENSHLFLIPTDTLYNHHYGIDEPHAGAIRKLNKSPEYLMNPNDASRLGIEEGASVTLSANGAELTVTPVFSEDVKEGHLILIGHYHDTGVQRLFQFSLDKESKTPVMGLIRVNLKKD